MLATAQQPNSDARPTESSPCGGDDGFTLIEVLIVIVVLGVLATVVVFAARGITDKGESASCQTDRRIIEDATEFYMVQNSVDAVPATGASDGDQFERTLVSEGLLGNVSEYHDLAADGTVTTTGVPCP